MYFAELVYHSSDKPNIRDCIRIGALAKTEQDVSISRQNGAKPCIHLDTINTLQALYEEMQVKFIGKVSSMGKERYALIFPRAHKKAGKVLKGACSSNP